MDENKQALDSQGLRQVIIDFPQQFAAGMILAKDIRISGQFKSLEISGMGGSSLPANILRIYLNDLYLKNPEANKQFGIFQNRFYSLPHEAYDQCLNFFASYSGNTEETVESLQEAIKAKLPSIGFATGGKVAELCQANNIPCVILPSGIQPRYATGYFFGAMLQVLVNTGLIEDKTAEIKALAEKLNGAIPELEKRGQLLAEKLKNKTPVIYASTKFKSLAMIWKIKINENAKTPAFFNFFPELNHNELVGWTLPQGQFHIITLLDKNDHPQNIKRMRITAALLREHGIETDFVEMENDHIFNTVFCALLLGDWASYYLALAYGQDPTPVDMVEDLKQKLA